MNPPKISIIVPVYKVEKHLRRCIESIIAQTFTSWECILIDDGSPDDSGKICDEYKEKNEKFKVIHQENHGVSAARNAGLDIAKGEWIGFVDSDDWIEPNMYEYLYNDAIKTKSDIVICGFIGQHNKRIKKKCGSKEAQMLLFAREGFGGFSFLRLIAAKMTKNIRFDTSMKYLEDVKFFYEIFRECKTIYWDNEQLYNYFQREDSITHKYGLTDEAKMGLVYLDKLYVEEQTLQIKSAIFLSKARFCLNLSSSYISHNDVKNESFIYLKKCVKSNLKQITFSNNYSIADKYYTLYHSFRLFFKYLKKLFLLR